MTNFVKSSGMLIWVMIALFSIQSCKKDRKEKDNDIPEVKKTDPLFPNSVVSNDIDFILETDEDDFVKMTYVGQSRQEMPDKRSDILFDNDSYVFEATFKNNKKVSICCHSSFNSKEAAELYADKLCPRLGKLPEVQRDMLTHVVIHKGDETAFGESKFFILYSDNMDDRISTHDLEETVFHESVHASLQTIYEESTEWQNVQKADGNYITTYARSKPSLEDMPETALFAYVAIKYPGRLPADVEEWVKNYIPNKLKFFKNIYE